MYLKIEIKFKKSAICILNHSNIIKQAQKTENPEFPLHTDTASIGIIIFFLFQEIIKVGKIDLTNLTGRNDFIDFLFLNLKWWQLMQLLYFTVICIVIILIIWVFLGK